jgi:arabinofuranan 3-O-arabinosyltransferase
VVLIGGQWALLAMAALTALALVRPGRRGQLTAVAVPCLLAGGVLLLGGAALEPARQVLASTALAAVAVSLWAPSGRDADTSDRQRRTGRSTST